MLTANAYTSVFAVHCDACGAKRGELGPDRDAAEATLRSEGWHDTLPFGKGREGALWACPKCVSSARRP